MRVPEELEVETPNFLVGCGIEDEHAEQHDMARDPSDLSVVNLNRLERTESESFDLHKTATQEFSAPWSFCFGRVNGMNLLGVMSRRVYGSPENDNESKVSV